MTLDHSIIRLSASPIGFGESRDELTAQMFESETPIQHSHDFYADESSGKYIGVWDTTDMVEASGLYPIDEFMVVLEGAAVIKNNVSGVSKTIYAGESFLIPKGLDCQWVQQGYLKKFYVILDDGCAPNKNEQEVLNFDRPKTEASRVNYQNEDKSFIAGCYRGAIADSPLVSAKEDLFIYLKKGSVTLIDHNLTEHKFVAGEAFVVLSGAQLGWRSVEDLEYHYVILPDKKDS